MVTVNDVTQMMFRWAPPELAMDWDNVGLLVGRGDREVHRVLVALDVSPDVAAEAAVLLVRQCLRKGIRRKRGIL